MRIKLGSHEVVESARFLAQVDESIFLKCVLDEQEAKFRIVFVTDDSEKGKDEYWMNTEPDPEIEDQGLITLINWNGPRQVAGPIKFFKSSKYQYYCSVSACFATDAYDVFVQITRESTDE